MTKESEAEIGVSFLQALQKDLIEENASREVVTRFFQKRAQHCDNFETALALESDVLDKKNLSRQIRRTQEQIDLLKKMG